MHWARWFLISFEYSILVILASHGEPCQYPSQDLVSVSEYNDLASIAKSKLMSRGCNRECVTK